MRPALVVALVGTALVLQGCLLCAAKKVGLIGNGPEVTVTANDRGANVTINGENITNNGPSITASGADTSDNRQVDEFHGLSVGSVIKLEYTQGPACSVQILAQKDVLPLIKTDVDDGVLDIELNGNVNNLHEIKAIVTSPTLDSLELSGSATGTARSVQADDFELKLSGSSALTIQGQCHQLKGDISGAAKLDEGLVADQGAELDVSGNASAALAGACRDSLKANVSGAAQLSFDNVSTETAEIEASGSSHVTLRGSAKSAKLTAEGASQIGPKDFSTEVCEAEASGASHIGVTANRSLSANAGGASQIQYGGQPTLDKDVSGASSVEPSP